MTSNVILTASQKVAFNRFMLEVAPKLTGTAVVLTAEEVLLAVQGLEVLAMHQMVADNSSIEDAEAFVFADLTKHVDAATLVEFKAALELVQNSVAPAPMDQDSVLSQCLDTIGSIISKSASAIWKALSFCFNKISSAVKTAFGWSLSKATLIAAYLKNTTFPAIGRGMVAVWDFTSQKVVTISKAVWTGLRAVCNAVLKVLVSIGKAVLGVLTAIDNKLSQWIPVAESFHVNVLLTSPCTISLQHRVLSQLAGSTCVKVTLRSKADVTLLAAQIKGHGSMV
jgi:hypothetical protein